MDGVVKVIKSSMCYVKARFPFNCYVPLMWSMECFDLCELFPQPFPSSREATIVFCNH